MADLSDSLVCACDVIERDWIETGQANPINIHSAYLALTLCQHIIQLKNISGTFTVPLNIQ